MARLNVRIDDTLHARLRYRADRAGITLSGMVRPALEHVADPRRGYVYSSQDEILATCLHILALLASVIRKHAPDGFEDGMAEARRILHERGLLNPELDQ